jgi:hypothetical protein
VKYPSIDGKGQEVVAILDGKASLAASELFNEAIHFLVNDGWFRADKVNGQTDDGWYWWRHHQEQGTFTIGAAVRRMHEREFERKAPR